MSGTAFQKIYTNYPSESRSSQLLTVSTQPFYSHCIGQPVLAGTSPTAFVAPKFYYVCALAAD